jgi:hypothetical protein
MITNVSIPMEDNAKFKRNTFVKFFLTPEEQTNIPDWFRKSLLEYKQSKDVVFKVSGYIIKGDVVLYRIEKNRVIIDNIPEKNLVASNEPILRTKWENNILNQGKKELKEEESEPQVTEARELSEELQEPVSHEEATPKDEVSSGEMQESLTEQDGKRPGNNKRTKSKAV